MPYALQQTIARIFSKPWIVPVVFFGVSFLLYGVTLWGEFVYDDAFFYKEGTLRSWHYLLDTWFRPSLNQLAVNAHYRPLTFATASLNFLFFGESPFSFHLVNVLLNGANCWLLFMLMRRLFGSVSLAWMTAILFACMPIHTEAVSYVKARDELLVAFFGLSAWLVFCRAAEANRRGLTLGIVAAFLSLAAFLSKESAVVLPGVLVGSMMLTQGVRKTLTAWPVICMQILAIVMFFALHGNAVGDTFISNSEVLFFGQNPLGYMTPDYVPWTAMQLFFLAVAKSIVPWNLSATYGYAHIPMITVPWGSWMSMAGIAVCLLFLALLILPRTRRSPLGVGVMVFLVLYFPFSKIPFYRSIDFFAERWLYAPSAGIAMLTGYVLWLFYRHVRQVAIAVFPAILMAYVLVLVPRTFVWRNETALGESMVRTAPNSVISYVFLANNRLQYARLPEAAELVTLGLRISREHMPIHHTAAAVALGVGNTDVAEQAVQAAEAIGGDELANVILRSTLLAKQHRYQESVDHVRASRWFDSTEYRTRMLLALNLWMLGHHEEAEQYFDWDAHLPVMKMSREQKIQMFESY